MWKIVFVALAIVADTQGTPESCMTAATGATVTLPLNYPDFKMDDELKWMHNSITILRRKKQKFITGQESSMMPNGSLTLTGLQLHDSGSYHAEVYNSDGVLTKQSSVTLCVMEKVSKPRVIYSCGTQLDLTCYLEKRPGSVTFEWTHNSIPLKGENGERLTVDGKSTSGTFSCGARNEVSQERSSDVLVTCGGLGSTISTLTQQSIPSGYNLPTPWLKPLLRLSVFCCLLITYF